MSDGPWISREYPSGVFVERPAQFEKCNSATDAIAKCDELNKTARREAASGQLLTMCRLTTKALSEYLRDGKPPEDVSFILAEAQRVIRAAEGEEKDQ